MNIRTPVVIGERIEGVTLKRSFVMYSELSEDDKKLWLVNGLLGQGEASAVYGQPGCGKSVLVEDMALHIAARREWLGRIAHYGAVVYVALERKKLVERRARAFRKKYGIAELPFAIVGGVLDFRLPTTAVWLADICAQVTRLTGEKVVLIVIDTLSRALAGGDENSPKDMGAIVTTTAQLQEATGSHVLWIHHMPHDGDRMRGHGALLGAMDTTLHVTRSGTGRTATVVKANDSEEGACIAFNLEGVQIGEDGTTAPLVVAQVRGTSLTSPTEPKLSTNQRVMYRLLVDAGKAGLMVEEWNELAKANGIATKQRHYELRMSLKDKGLAREYSGRWNANSG